mgnify:CR=1 FL=1
MRTVAMVEALPQLPPLLHALRRVLANERVALVYLETFNGWATNWNVRKSTPQPDPELLDAESVPSLAAPSNPEADAYAKMAAQYLQIGGEENEQDQGDCFLLDLGDTLYPWFGEDASPFERAKCGTRAHNVAISRHGKCAVKEAPDAAFWSALGGEGPIAPASEAPAPEKEDVGEGVLYKLSDSTGSLTCTEAKRGDIKVTDLDSNDVFILDAGREIFVWVGSKASDAERRNAMPTAQAYLHANNKPIHTAVHCVNEGTPFTNEVWKAIMK